MTIYTRPDGKVFAKSAKSGEVADFPDIDRGWGVAFEETGGIPPMEWFNSVGMRADKATAYYLQRGVPEWAATEDYPAGACVQYAGKTYQAKVANQRKQPDISATEWERWALSPGDITTPAQFDNSTKIATTEFVKKRGLLYSGVYELQTSSYQLKSEDVGRVIFCQNSGGILNVVRPDSLGVSIGDSFTVVAYAAGPLVVNFISGSSLIYNSNTIKSITVNPGESLSITVWSFEQWVVTGGTAAMGNLASFGASLGSNGYQKLPSGLILQWMCGTAGASGTYVQNTLPITFPSTSLCVQAIHIGTDPSTNIVVGAGYSKTTVSLMSNISYPVSAHVLVIGY